MSGFDVTIDDIVMKMERARWIKQLFPNLYGRVERHIRYEKKKKIIVPVLYAGQGEYIDMRPYDTANNSWWYVHDNQEVLNGGNSAIVNLKATVSVVFWYRLDVDERKTEDVKRNLLYFLNNVPIENATFKAKRVYETPETIFKDFTVESKNLPYTMHPYAGIRIEGEMVVQSSCYDSMVGKTFNIDYDKQDYR